MKYIFLFSLLLLSSVTYSCSCIPLGKIDEKQYGEYDLIIKGKITRLVEKSFSRIIYIKVDTYFKGRENTTIIKVESPSQSGMCGIFPKIGEQWLVFAHKNGNSYNTSLCTRTKNLNPKAWDFKKDEIDEDLKFLESKLKATAANKKFGNMVAGQKYNRQFLQSKAHEDVGS